MYHQLPLFYTTEIITKGAIIALEDATARHAGVVLRMQNGDELLLTNGKGVAAKATIHVMHKKAVLVQLDSLLAAPTYTGRITAIALSPVKNTARLEWFIEKATELGVTQIFLLQTARTERQHLRYDRLQQIAVSAMLQSRQYYLPEIHPLQTMAEFLSNATHQHKWIAHCLPNEKTMLASAIQDTAEALVLIGPEGDFTEAEIALAMQQQFVPVSLGETRLRTETAALAAATICRLIP